MNFNRLNSTLPPFAHKEKLPLPRRLGPEQAVVEFVPPLQARTAWEKKRLSRKKTNTHRR